MDQPIEAFVEAYLDGYYLGLLEAKRMIYDLEGGRPAIPDEDGLGDLLGDQDGDE